MKPSKTYHIDRDRFLLDGIDVTSSFFGPDESPQNWDIVDLGIELADCGLISHRDQIIIDNLDKCITCGADIDGGVTCGDCQNKHNVAEIHKLNGCY